MSFVANIVLPNTIDVDRLNFEFAFSKFGLLALLGNLTECNLFIAVYDLLHILANSNHK